MGIKPELNGKRFDVLLTKGQFSLVDTSATKGDVRDYSIAWIWHLCEAYELLRIKEETDTKDVVPNIGLLSNSEISQERCGYCQARVPAGLIATWKMMNWDEHAHDFFIIANLDPPWGWGP